MNQIGVDMAAYYRIYDVLYENPFISAQGLSECTGIPEKKISQHLQTMYESSILYGPLIFLTPAQNRRQYTYFLLFDYPLEMYKRLSSTPHIIDTTLSAGNWNILAITDTEMDFSLKEEFKRCIHSGLKGRTHLSKVTVRDWDTCIKTIEDTLHPPEKESTLYEEIPYLSWGKKEWTLYKKFARNIRADSEPVLESCSISHSHYKKWISQLPQVAVIQPAFYPHGIDTCSVFQFLFKSQYQNQLSTILGMFPRTSVFFSTGDHLLAHVYTETQKEHDDLYSLIFRLKEEKYFTNFSHAVLVGGRSHKKSSRKTNP